MRDRPILFATLVVAALLAASWWCVQRSSSDDRMISSVPSCDDADVIELLETHMTRAWPYLDSPSLAGTRVRLVSVEAQGPRECKATYTLEDNTTATRSVQMEVEESPRAERRISVSKITLPYESQRWCHDAECRGYVT